MPFQDYLQTPQQFGLQDLYAQPERDAMRWAIKQGRAGMEGAQPTFEAIPELARRQFFQDTLPTMREGFGGDAMLGSGAPARMLGAGADLEAHLAALREQHEMGLFDRYRSLFGMGLQPQAPWHTRAEITPFGQYLASGAQALGAQGMSGQNVGWGDAWENTVAKGLQSGIGGGTVKAGPDIWSKLSQAGAGMASGAMSGAAGGWPGMLAGAATGGLASIISGLVGR